MEKALSMFSEDFGSFMRPHSEPLAFPGKSSVGRGGAQGGDTCSSAPPAVAAAAELLGAGAVQLPPRVTTGTDAATETDVAVRTGRPSRNSSGLGLSYMHPYSRPGVGHYRHIHTPPHLCWVRPHPPGGKGVLQEGRWQGGWQLRLRGSSGPGGQPLPSGGGAGDLGSECQPSPQPVPGGRATSRPWEMPMSLPWT